MYRYELDSIIEDMAKAYRIDINHVTKETSDLFFLDHGFRNFIYGDFDYNLLFNDMIKDIEDTSPVSYLDSFGINYLIFKEKLPQSAEEKFTILGAYNTEATSQSTITQYLEDNGVPFSMLEDTISFYNRCPVIQDVQQWHTLIIRLLQRYYGVDVSIQYRKYSPTSISAKVNSEKINAIPDSMAKFAEMEERYAVEHRLIEAVKAGETSKALNTTNEFMKFKMSARIADPLRDAKDNVIAVNTLLRKAAEAAYVAPLYIDDLNAKLTADIEACTSVSQVFSVNSNIIRRYCMLVQTYSRANYHSIVRGTLNYIDVHYQEDLSLSFFADKFSVTKNYLSALFHEQVDMTLTDYINHTRIQHSLLLLNTTDISMSDIASACGFNDANYFTRAFKKQKGISPSAYRKSLRQ